MRRVQISAILLIVQLTVLLLAAVPALAANGAAIAGSVYHDVDGDGWASPGEPGVAYATVYVQRLAGETVTTQADATGCFIVRDLQMGMYEIWAEDNAGHRSALRSVEVGEVNGAVAIDLPIEYSLPDDIIQAAADLFLPLVRH